MTIKRDKAVVAIDRKGKVAMTFNSITSAVSFMETTRKKLLYHMEKKREVFGFLWIRKEEYDALTKKEKASLVPKKKKRRKSTKEEKEWRKENNTRARMYSKEVFAKNFIEFSKYHVEWLHQLKDKWLERGDFGIRAELLADFYTDKRDKEIALLVSLLIPKGERCLERISVVREVIGEHPWEWFKERGFSGVKCSIWQFGRRLFRCLNDLWLECFRYGSYDSIEDLARENCADGVLSYLDFFCRFLKVGYWHVNRFRIAIVLLVFSRSDGLGQGLWNIGRNDVKIPVTDVLRDFLKTWIPDFHRYGDAEDCIALFGMDSVDFYYAFLAYEELKRIHPQACSRYSTKYLNAYKLSSYIEPSYWRNILPEIDFDSIECFVEEL